jgi:hypothetical protein
MDGTPVSVIPESAGQPARLDIRSPGPIPTGMLSGLPGGKPESCPTGTVSEGKPTRFQRWVGDTLCLVRAGVVRLPRANRRAKRRVLHAGGGVLERAVTRARPPGLGAHPGARPEKPPYVGVVSLSACENRRAPPYDQVRPRGAHPGARHIWSATH